MLSQEPQPDIVQKYLAERFKYDKIISVLCLLALFEGFKNTFLNVFFNI